MSKQLFESYPSIDTFHVTSDGQAFEQEHHAQAHARTLKEKGITPIHRNAPVEEVKEPIEEAVEPIEEAAEPIEEAAEPIEEVEEAVKKPAKK